MIQMIRRIYNMLVGTFGVTNGVLPTSADGVANLAITLTSGAGVFVGGVITQIVAAVAVPQDIWIYGFTVENPTGVLANHEVDIYRGPVGAEITIAACYVNNALFLFSRPLFCPANTRISGQLYSSAAVAVSLDIKLLTVSGL